MKINCRARYKIRKTDNPNGEGLMKMFTITCFHFSKLNIVSKSIDVSRKFILISIFFNPNQYVFFRIAREAERTLKNHQKFYNFTILDMYDCEVVKTAFIREFEYIIYPFYRTFAI